MIKKIILVLLALIVLSGTCFAGDIQIRFTGINSIGYEYTIFDNGNEVQVLDYSIKTMSSRGDHCVAVGITPMVLYSHLPNGVVYDNNTNEVITESAMTRSEAAQACAEHWYRMYYKPYEGK